MRTLRIGTAISLLLMSGLCVAHAQSSDRTVRIATGPQGQTYERVYGGRLGRFLKAYDVQFVATAGSVENVEVVRRVVEPERIVASSAEGFAIDGGRVVSASLEQAGAPLSAAGWTDRPVEILTPQRRKEVTQAPGQECPQATGAHGWALSQAEALRLLDSVEY